MYRSTDIIYFWDYAKALKNGCPSEIVIAIGQYRELPHDSILSRVTYQPEWLAENTVVCERPISIIGAVYRARENTRLARDTAIIARSNTNVNFYVALLRNRSKSFAVRDFCPGVLRLNLSPSALQRAL